MTEGKNTKNVDIYMVQNTGGWRNEKDVMKYSMSILYYLYQEVGHQVQTGRQKPMGFAQRCIECGNFIQ